jgi:hypothetical protein
MVLLLPLRDPPKPASAGVGSDYVGRIWERNKSTELFSFTDMVVP